MVINCSLDFLIRFKFYSPSVLVFCEHLRAQNISGKIRHKAEFPLCPGKFFMCAREFHKIIALIHLNKQLAMML